MTMEGKILGDPIIRRSQRSTRQETIHYDIFTPRTYQVELLDTALKRNTIVCLGTGSGKTFIAVMLIRELAHQIRVPFEDEGKRTIFLVNTVALVGQQAAVIRLHTDLSVGEYTGEMAVDLWTEQEWLQQFAAHQVLVMTSQIFLDVLHHAFLTLSRVNLIVFDECHHATKSHPYVQVMKCWDSCPSKSVPRVLGLTASVLNNKCRTPEELEQNLLQLERTLHSKAETASDMTVHDIHTTKPKEIIMECDDYEDETGLVQQFDTTLQDVLDFLVDCRIKFDPEEGQKNPCIVPRTVLQECQYVLHTLGPWCAGKVAHSLLKQLSSLEENEADPQSRMFVQLAETQLRMVEHIMNHVYDNSIMCLEDFMLYMSPKVRRLVEILHQYKPEDNFVILGGDDMGLEGVASSDGEEGDDDDDGGDIDSLLSDEEYEDEGHGTRGHSSRGPRFHYVAIKRKPCGEAGDENKEDESLCGIVFCERRHTAFILNNLITELCNWDTDLFFVQSSHITGHNAQGPGKVKAGNTVFKKQEEILRKFRQREINLLISTSLLEEGIDVPKCNLVVRFDHPTDYRSYLQSKGRARATNSKYFMLVYKECMEQFQLDLKIFKGFENILLHKSVDAEESGEETEGCLEDVIPPYMPGGGEGAPRVTLDSAIALVNRYCAKLPSDAFTHLTPLCTIQEQPGEDGPLYLATLQLPINSPIKYPIKGEVMPSKRLARKAAALKTCETLHKAGELDDHLLPVGKEMIKYEDDENEWEQAELMGQARPGTTKRKQYYFKKVAEPLLGKVRPCQTCYMYNISLKLTCPITEEQNTRGRKIYAPEESPRGFGLISDSLIPPVPKFPVFTRSGEVTVSLDLMAKDVTFTEVELSRIIDFHHYVFSQVLRLEKEPMNFDWELAESGYFILPLNKGSEGRCVIDWDFIEQIEQAPPAASKRTPAKEDGTKEEFVFSNEDFENAVVMPSYRNIDQPQYFYVAEIRHDLNPLCSFPSPELYDTFEHYYRSKYGLKITNLNQPLLDVDHTSARLNLLTPRYMNQKGVALPTSSAETRKARRENLQQKQILIPELCDVHPFPASLWRKAVCLPAILYRVNYLLIAEELRLLIAREAHIGIVDLPTDFCFPELEFGFSTKPTAVSSAETSGSNTRKGSTENQEVGSALDLGSKALGEGEAMKPAQSIDSIDRENGNSSQGDTQQGGPHSGETADQVCLSCDAASNIPKSGSLNASNAARAKTEGHNGNEATDEDRGADVTTDIDTAKPAKVESSHTTPNGIVPSLGEAKDLRPSSSQKEKRSDKENGIQNLNEYCSQGCTVTAAKSTESDVEAASVAAANPISCPPGEPNTAAPCCTVMVGPSMDAPDSTLQSDTAGSCVAVATTIAELDIEIDCDTVPTLSNSCDSMSAAGDTPSMEAAADVYQKLVSRGSHSVPLQSGDSAAEEQTDEQLAEGKSEQNYAAPVRFDHEEDLSTFVGPSPCIILQTLTMSNANDFFNLERLETIGDSFLKFAITVYLYCTYPGIHEGKLSYLRSKQVSNYNLYKLGKRKLLPDCMIAAKFEPMENWLPPGYMVKSEGAFKGLTASSKGRMKEMQSSQETDQKQECSANDGPIEQNSEVAETGREPPGEAQEVRDASSGLGQAMRVNTEQINFNRELEECLKSEDCDQADRAADAKCLVPYNLQTQHSLPDKSIADCVEALIGCYLVTCGQTAALQLMSWLGLKVLPEHNQRTQERSSAELPGSAEPTTVSETQTDLTHKQPGFGLLHAPLSPLLTHIPGAAKTCAFYLNGYEEFEKSIKYSFRDRSYLLQAFTHASYHYNTVTDCYQRLEFLGDAILDYVITRHLFEDPRKHSPGILTDLRSALVNNNIFAALAVKWNFHKYFKAISPQLFSVVDRFVTWQKDKNDEIDLDEEFEDREEGKEEEGEDIEIPKALGDIFESVAGAIYLDSGMSLDTVWKVYYRMMQPQIDAFTEKIPKSPVRELLEMEPETAKFEKPERTLGGKIRVTVNVVGKGNFKGVGRNYRIAKSAAAKRALKYIRAYNIEMEKFKKKHEALMIAAGVLQA